MRDMRYGGFIIERGLVAALTLAACVLCADAAPPPNGDVRIGGSPKEFSAVELEWVKSGLSPATVSSELRMWADRLRDSGDVKKVMSPTEIWLHATQVKRWADYYFVEHDTGISRAWLTGCAKYLDALGTARSKIRDLEMRRETGQEEYRKWVDYYRRTSQQFHEIVQKPVRADDRALISALAREKQELLKSLAGTSEKAGRSGDGVKRKP